MSVKKPNISTAYKLLKNVRLWGRKSPVYIVVHFTGGFSSKSDSLGGMASCYKAFMEAGSNAHYLVGRDAIWEMVNPKIFYCTYSCGSGVGRKNVCKIPGWGPSSYTGPLSMSHASVAGHSNTINIEICSCKAGKKRCDPMDDGWYFNTETYKNAVELCAWLCDEFSIKISNIIMHNQITGKLCPAMWCNRPGAEVEFNQFKQDVSAIVNDVQGSSSIETPNPEPSTDVITVPADTLFYSRPTFDAPIVFNASYDMSVEYTAQSGAFFYTSMGWVSP